MDIVIDTNRIRTTEALIVSENIIVKLPSSAAYRYNGIIAFLMTLYLVILKLEEIGNNDWTLRVWSHRIHKNT
jgi:hypothetical protein